MSTALIAQGYREAQALTQRHAKSFSFASLVLFGRRRQAAFALYAFCRRLDDLVDEGSPEPADVQRRLTLARALVDDVFAGRVPDAVPAGFSVPELHALADTVRRYRVPAAPLHELITGMETDLRPVRVRTFAELDLYCHRVAGVVGLLMTPVLGFSDAACLPYADLLGRAMQLTNILRDVREDLERGRVYLPADELERFGVVISAAPHQRTPEAWAAFMRFQVQRARQAYARAELGIAHLTGFGSQRLVRLMARLYAGILDDLEARGFDVFSARAHVPLPRKLWLLAKVMLTPAPPAASLPALTAGEGHA